MESRYDLVQAANMVERYAPRWGEDLALRVYTSRLLGGEPTLVLHGGGNTSVKTTARELTGEVVEVLYVKGSGRDLADIGPMGFPACRLEPLRQLCRRDSLTDNVLAQGLRGQTLDPDSPMPSVETLLHALLPGRFVDHTHADAVLAIVDQPDAADRVREVWDDTMLFVPYVMPGVPLARSVASLVGELGDVRGLILDKHGIVTWGDSARESYEAMIARVSEAEASLEQARRRVSIRASGHLDRGQRLERQKELAPVVRGALARARHGRPFVLEWRDEPQILALLGRADARARSCVGPVTPDHVIRVRPWPLWLGDLPAGPMGEAARHHVEEALMRYGEAYDRYYERGISARGWTPAYLDPLPRVVLVPEVGALCAGTTRREARAACDLYAHTASVILDALAIGEYQPVGDLDLFDMEYWSLEQAKLAREEAGPLDGHIALVTGAAGGIGLATSAHLLDLGAHVVLSDRDQTALEEAAVPLLQRFGLRLETARADVTVQEDVERLFDTVVATFGGLDIVVSNAGTAPGGLLHQRRGHDALVASLDVNLLSHQRVARQAARVLLEQGSGGCLLFNASKSAFNQGPEFGPYAVPKAGLVALMKQYAVDLGRYGVRSNAVNADRIRTGLFGGGVLEARARARGVSPDEYFRQNLLKRETTAEDVARAFGWLASAEATTGCVVTVDGGNPAAFPR